jgi:hypothetical protein
MIAFDDYGNTGADLMQGEQPIFVLSSVNFSNDEVVELRNIFRVKAEELKFINIKRRGTYHPSLIQLYDHPLITQNTVKCQVFHKQYSVWVQIADRILEPSFEREGIDLYKDGMNIAHTNLMALTAPVFCDPNDVVVFQRAFLRMFKEQSNDSINTFYNLTLHLYKTCSDKDFAGILIGIYSTKEYIDDILSHHDPLSFDATLTSFINLIDYWGRKSSTTFDVVIDPSHAMEHFKMYVERVKKINITPQIIGADRRNYLLPFKLGKVTPVDSKAATIVQLADLIAGGVGYYYRAVATNSHDTLSERIAKTNLIKLKHNFVWPHSAMTPEELGINDNGNPSVLDSIVGLSIKAEGE